MNKLLLSAAMAGVLAAGTSSVAYAGDKAKEKCYGVAKAGKNACASADGSHSCAGQATKDNDANEWKYVAKGECEGMGGTVKAGAKAGKHSCKEGADGKASCKEGMEGKHSCKEGAKGKHSCKEAAEGKASCKEGTDGKHSCEGKDKK